MEVASKQHDVYHQALGIIVSKCNLYTEFPDLFWGMCCNFGLRRLVA